MSESIYRFYIEQPELENYFKKRIVLQYALKNDLTKVNLDNYIIKMQACNWNDKNDGSIDFSFYVIDKNKDYETAEGPNYHVGRYRHLLSFADPLIDNVSMDIRLWALKRRFNEGELWEMVDEKFTGKYKKAAKKIIKRWKDGNVLLYDVCNRMFFDYD